MCAATGGSQEKFVDLYHEAKDQSRYDFMTLDLRGLKCYRNFTDELYDKDKEMGQVEREDSEETDDEN